MSILRHLLLIGTVKNPWRKKYFYRMGNNKKKVNTLVRLFGVFYDYRRKGEQRKKIFRW